MVPPLPCCDFKLIVEGGPKYSPSGLGFRGCLLSAKPLLLPLLQLLLGRTEAEMILIFLVLIAE